MPSFTQKFYSSDFHFGHRGILHHCAATRPFDSVEEMDAKIVDNINERVGSNDMLYILGDFALSGDADYVRHLFHAIHGRKILILGNHDVDRSGRVNNVIRDLPWDRPPVAALETTDEGCRLYLHHYACRTWPTAHHGAYHLYGHSHGTLPPYGLSRDVGIDCPITNFAPMTFAEIRETLDA